MAGPEQLHWMIDSEVRIEQTRRRLARLREEGLFDRINLLQAGRIRVMASHSVQYSVQLVAE
ncbi:hypothetical protein [Streptomyces vastus]|uniref:Uncharacterized protein n=1 Tax=Streptomyces vastus TaxID=285451 RepID=A0ABP6CTE3_9ACTN